MKKIILFGALIFAFQMTGLSQVLFENDFSNGLGDMQAWDLDMGTPNGNVPYSTWSVVGTGASAYVISASWQTGPTTANDWLVTPEMTIAEANTFLGYDSRSPDAAYPDALTIKVSTTGNDDAAKFTDVIYAATPQPSSWSSNAINLDAYVGETISIAFINNSTDQYVLALDNIIVEKPVPLAANLDGNAANINFGTALAESERDFSITFTNKGLDDITSVDATVKLNGSTVLSESFSGLDVPYYGSGQLDFASQFQHPAVGTAELTIELSNFNGSGEGDASSTTDYTTLSPTPNFNAVDTKGNDVDFHSILAEGKTVVLDFFASWCGPCQSSTPELNTFYVDNQDDLTVLGVTIEQDDSTNQIVNGLGWGATYPKFSFDQELYILSYIHYSYNHELGENAIPFFVMICPNKDNPDNSEIAHYDTGFLSGMFSSAFQPAHDQCQSIINSADDIAAVSSIKAFPNPAREELTLQLELATNENLAFRVVDMTGREVKTFPMARYLAGNTQLEINTNELSSGLYSIFITSDTGQEVVKFSVVK